jgi:phosphoribosylformimino-5-aminoimidazole carboxamide ribotide isomerase
VVVGVSRRQAALGALGAWPGGLQLGGGVNLDNAKQWLDAGASHVIVTSFVFREGRLEEDRLKALVSGLAWALLHPGQTHCLQHTCVC